MVVLLCALLAWSATALVPARPRALRLDPRAAALVESAGLVPAGAVHVSEDLAAKTQTFDVELAAPLGLTLGESVVDGASRVHVRSGTCACGKRACWGHRAPLGAMRPGSG